LKCLSKLRRCTRQSLHIRKPKHASIHNEDSKEEVKCNSDTSLIQEPSNTAFTLDFENCKRNLEVSYLTCPVCMDFFVGAVTALCGHTFCERCLFEWALFNKDCPVCRQKVKQEAPYSSLMIDSLVQSYLDQSSLNTERETLKIKKQELNKWKASRT